MLVMLHVSKVLSVSTVTENSLVWRFLVCKFISVTVGQPGMVPGWPVRYFLFLKHKGAAQ
jgi:hypothetical protein